MDNSVHIHEELKKICPLLPHSKHLDYSVPLSYFDNFPTILINKMNLRKEYAVFFGSHPDYSIPKDYFETNPEIILKKALAEPQKKEEVFEELEEIAPLLNAISKKTVYTVPTNFFDTLAVQSTVFQQEKAKIISLKKRSRRFRIAAAAVIIPCLAIGLYTLTGKDGIKNSSRNARNEIKNLTREEILNFLKRNTYTPEEISTSQNNSSHEEKLQSSLKKISDKEIQQFLKETGESDEI